MQHLQTYNDEQRLWNNSPCSLNYALQNPSMDKTPKFDIGSIYYRDEVNKPKRVFDDLQKPEQLLTQFRNQLKEVEYLKRKFHQKKKKDFKRIEGASLSSVGNKTCSRLYEVPDKSEYKYDRYGLRSNYVGDYNVKDIEQGVMRKKKSFTCGRRTDLGKPINFYPGPGTYSVDKQPSRRVKTCTNFHRKQLFSLYTRKISQKWKKNNFQQ